MRLFADLVSVMSVLQVFSDWKFAVVLGMTAWMGLAILLSPLPIMRE